jgi:hypothetical protein
VSYNFAIAGDALADLRALEVWLQEVLDEIEIIAASESILPSLPNTGDTVYAFSRAAAGFKHHIALILTRNDAIQMFTVLGSFIRFKDDPASFAHTASAITLSELACRQSL